MAPVRPGQTFTRWGQPAPTPAPAAPTGGMNEWANAAANTDPGWAGTFWRTLAPYGQQGAFNPMGNQAILDMIMRKGNEMGAGGVARARTSAKLAGLDPAASASYGLQAGIKGQSDTSNAVQEAMLRQLMSGQDWARQILGGYLGQNTGAMANAGASHYVAGADPRGGNGIGQLLGGVAGSFLSPLGQSLGSRIGKNTNPQPQMPNPQTWWP